MVNFLVRFRGWPTISIGGVPNGIIHTSRHRLRLRTSKTDAANQNSANNLPLPSILSLMPLERSANQ
jgi:hypothetical protein